MAVCYRDTIMEAKETLKMLIDQNEEIRMSFDIILVDIVKPLLRKMDVAFKPGLSRVQWLSSDLKFYTIYVKEVLIAQDNTFDHSDSNAIYICLHRNWTK